MISQLSQAPSSLRVKASPRNEASSVKIVEDNPDVHEMDSTLRLGNFETEDGSSRQRECCRSDDHR